MKIRAYFITLSFLLATLTACQDETLNLPAPAMPDSTVPVELSIGFADEEDGYGTGNDSRTVIGVGDDAATGLDAQLVPETKSRVNTETKPDKLYKLSVIQLNSEGTSVLKTTNYSDAKDIGSKITLTLSESTNCQLVIIARGSTGSANITPGNWSALTNYKATENTIYKLNETTGINDMPYILHLKRVIVTSDGRIQNPDGSDVRLRLKRLAAKLTVKWKFSVADYSLEEVRLCQIPKEFYFFPETENSDWVTGKNSYPTLVKEYIDYFRLTGNELTSGGTVDDATASGTVSTDGDYSVYTTWLPANVKGTASEATAPSYRNKDIAPTGAGYLEFVAVKKNASNEVQERLFYRVYLGGKETTDFNVCENTNYVWTVNINGANYIKDPRIDRQETTPVPQKDDNFKNTANCFMVQPNSSFSFNPYKHEAGTNGWNDQLTDTSTGTIKTNQEITGIKLLWQSKDSGTTGTLVMGYQLKDNDYANQMVLTNAGDPEKARIYVRIPYSKGGNAVIAAYHKAPGDSKETIVWSWHLWITDYVPARINTDVGYSDYEAAQKRSLNGTVHKYRSPIWTEGKTYANMVMMDRDLGAKKGGFPGIGKADHEKDYTQMDAVNRMGLLYQWGRKDPFFGSPDGTTTEINVIYDGNGMPLSITKTTGGFTLADAIQHPSIFYPCGNSKLNEKSRSSWNTSNTAPGKKTIYDPSPEGWKVPMNGATLNGNDLLSTGSGIFAQLGIPTGSYKSEGASILLTANSSYFTYSRYYSQNQFYQYETNTPSTTNNPRGGRIFFLTDNISDDSKNWTINNTMWIPVSAERYRSDGNLTYPNLGHIWLADYSSGQDLCCGYIGIEAKKISLGFYYFSYGWSVRCIQDNKD